LESPLVRELPDGRFAYEPQARKGMAGDDATTIAAWRDTDAGRRVHTAVYTKEGWRQPFYIRKIAYKNLEIWEAKRRTFKADAAADHAFRFMHMHELPKGYTYHSRSMHRRRKSAASAESAAAAAGAQT